MKQLIKLFFLLTFAFLSAYATPTPTVAPNLDAASDSGASNTDNITNQTTLLTFLGSKESNETIKLYRGATLVFEDLNNTSTSYSISDSTFLFDGLYSYTVSANDGTGESAKSPALNVTIDKTFSPGLVTANSITADDVINSAESGSVITITGSASGGDISSGDSMDMTVFGTVYYPVLSGTSWTVNVNGSDLAADTSFVINVSSSDVAGNTGSSTVTSNHSVDTSSYITIGTIEPVLSYAPGSYLEPGYNIYWTADIYSGITFTINGSSYTSTSSPMYISNTDLGLTDNSIYDVLLDAGQTDAAGNTAVLTNGNFTFDKTADLIGSAKPIDIDGGSFSEYLSVGDTDYFIFEVSSKGYVTLNSGLAGVNIRLLNLSGAVVEDPVSQSLSKVLDKGSYIVEVAYTATSGAYTLTTNITYIADEMDADFIPKDNTSTNIVTPGIANYMKIDGGVVYLSNNRKIDINTPVSVVTNLNMATKFDIKDGNVVYTDFYDLIIQNISSGDIISTGLSYADGFGGTSVSVLGDYAYVLKHDSVEIFNISDLNNVTSGSITLPTFGSLNGDVYADFIAYSVAGKTYLYVTHTDTYNNAAVVVIDITTTPTIIGYLDSMGNISDLAVDKGLLYVSSSTNGVSVFNISTEADAASPKFLTKTTVGSYAVGAYNNKLYILENSGSLVSYDLALDYSDTVDDPLLLDKVALNSTINMNRISGKADVDIFTFDTEYFGDLSFSTNEASGDVNITIASDSTFTTIVRSATALNTVPTTSNMPAQRYYVKIEAPSATTFESYSLTNFFTTDAAKDRLLNSSLATQEAVLLDQNITSNIEHASDIDLYKVILPSDGYFNLTTTAGTVDLYSASVDSLSSYATLTLVPTPNPIKAETYYIRVSHTGPTAYTVTPTYTSYADSDENQNNLSVGATALSDTIQYSGHIYVNNGVVYSQDIVTTSLYLGNNEIYSSASKNYFAQVSDGRYIYALSLEYIVLDETTKKLSLDVLEYVNGSNVVLRTTKVLSTTVSSAKSYPDYADFNMKIVDGKLIVKKDEGWIEYNISDPLNIPNSSTSYLSGTYLDFEIDGDYIYALTASKVDKLLKSDKSNQATKTFVETLTSIEVVDDVVYIGTASNGIKAVRTSDLSFIKDIPTVQNVVSIESSGNTLYVSKAVQSENNKLVTIEIEKDFGDYFSGATLIPFDTTITGQIDSVNENDYFKIDLEQTGSITAGTTGGVTCTLYSENDLLSNIGCSTVNVVAGRYYIGLTNATEVSYTINVSTTPLSNDITDSLSFYDGDITNITDQNATFSSSIDVVGDIDYYKIELDTTGLLDLNDTNAVLVYENGQEVAKDIDGKYIVDIAGEYFIKVTGGVGGYDVGASFESIVDDKYIDEATDASNALISSIKLGGNNPKILSSGNIAYLADEVDGLSVIDVSDTQNPVVVTRINLEGSPKKLQLDGTMLYIALGDDGFAMVDVSDANSSYLYTQKNIGKTVYAVSSKGSKVYLGHDSGIDMYDVSNPLDPVYEKSISVSTSHDILMDSSNLIVAWASGVTIVDADLNASTPVSLAAGTSLLAKDSEYIFAYDAQGIIRILDASYTDVGKSITIAGVQDLYANNKILYASTTTGYKIIEYKDINYINSISINGSVKSITLTNSALLLAKSGELSIVEAVPDYADNLTAQVHTKIDISQSPTPTTGQFSKTGDVDTFELVHVDYTGNINLSIVADYNITINLYDEGYNLLATGTNSVGLLVNAGDIYVQIEAQTPDDYFSYALNYTYVTDGVKDILDVNYNNEEMFKNDNISSTLYTGGNDKDYYKFIMDSRGELSFDSANNQNIKISILYKSGTVMASNYDADTGEINTDFSVTLSEGEYFVLVENSDTSPTTTQNYSIVTSFEETTEVDLEQGASVDSLDSIAAFSYVDKFSYMLRDGVVHRMSNILESKNKNEIFQLNGDYNINIFSYSHDEWEESFISKVDPLDSTQNRIFVLDYNIEASTFDNFYEVFINGISDEDILYIDADKYVYYYDYDSLYISHMDFTLEVAQQLALQNLSIVKVDGDYMYVVTDQFVQIVDVSDKTDIDASKILSTINTTDIKSIYVYGDILFVGANNKIEVWNISDKASATLISEFEIGFSEGDLYYVGTPTSMYMLDNTLYTTIEGVGLVFFELNEFNALSISQKALNIGEGLTDIYTYHGEAVNYVVDNELKVYFTSSQILDAASTGTYDVIDGSVQEGSSTFEGCFIATAAYGSYFDENVKVLRDFRDSYLMHNEIGRIFVDFYYEKSPAIAKSIVDNETLKSIIRVVLMPVVFIIKYPLTLLFMILILLASSYMKFRKKTTKKLGTI